jgi:hypothetical protein
MRKSIRKPTLVNEVTLFPEKVANTLLCNRLNRALFVDVLVVISFN